ncbi:MAG: hypothetical protein ACJ8F7_11120 [Gemmataceae bacterium]
MRALVLVALVMAGVSISGELCGQSPAPVPVDLIAPPSTAQQALQATPLETVVPVTGAGMFSSVTGAVVKPFFAEPRWFGSGFNHVELALTWVAQIQVGYRRENGASWLVNFEYEPLHFQNDSAGTFPLLYLDIDRLSGNKSTQPGVDFRWLLGLRAYDLGIGPHLGGVVTWGLDESPWSCRFKADVGYLLPYTLNGRAELGLAYTPPSRPGLRAEAGAMVETTWFLIFGGVGPGVYACLNWRY